jgi:hypothetical protein
VALGNAGNDTFRYSGPLDGHDLIADFDGDAAGGQDVLNLDALFDKLGVAGADRAGRVSLTDGGSAVDVAIDADGNAANGFELKAVTLITDRCVALGDGRYPEQLIARRYGRPRRRTGAGDWSHPSRKNRSVRQRAAARPLARGSAKDVEMLKWSEMAGSSRHRSLAAFMPCALAADEPADERRPAAQLPSEPPPRAGQDRQGAPEQQGQRRTARRQLQGSAGAARNQCARPDSCEGKNQTIPTKLDASLPHPLAPPGQPRLWSCGGLSAYSS